MKKLLAFAIAMSAGSALADNKTEAQDHKAKAAAAYKEKRWQDVLDELNKAYALDPDPNLHFALGQVYAKMDRCSEAIASYEAFLTSNPAADNAGVAREAIDACKKILADKPPPPVEPLPEQPAPVTPPVQAPIDHSAGGRWYHDRLGVGLVGGGGALVVLGGVFYLAARGTLSDANDAATYGEQADKYDSAKTKRTLGVVFGLGGAALVGVGVYHYMKKGKQEHRVGLVPARDGGFVTWSGGF